IGNKQFRPPVEQKRVNRSRPNLAGVTTLGSTFDRQQNFGGRLSGRAPTRWPFVKLCDFVFTLFFPSTLQVRRNFRLSCIMHQTTWFRCYTCLLGEESLKFTFWGLRPPKPPICFP